MSMKVGTISIAGPQDMGHISHSIEIQDVTLNDDESLTIVASGSNRESQIEIHFDVGVAHKLAMALYHIGHTN